MKSINFLQGGFVLSLQREDLITILNNINEGVHVVDEQGKTIIYNDKIAELEGMDKETVIGKKLEDVFPALDKKNSTLLQTLQYKEPIKNEQQEYLNKYGEKIITVNSTIPLNLESGTTWALEIAQDITNIKNLYNKITQLQEKLYNEEDDNESNLYTFFDIKGEDKKLKEIIKHARLAAKTDSSVLITGDTGTGKELFAQSIHSSSKRNNKPFIAQNCAALPENLLEGILFGTKKGGFTGAVDRKGLFEQAKGGTLFLDEINSMTTALQAKLLRVLQEGKVRSVGGKKEKKVDVRIIATLNSSPIKAIEDGNLREDLYYRLGVVLLNLPLLSERKGDILLLAEHFINHFNKKFDCQVEGLSKKVEELYLSYSWPGNVRQLEHVIEGAMNIMGDKKQIEENHIKPYLLKGKEEKNNEDNLDFSSLPQKLNKIEKELIIETLDKANGNITRAARQLGIKRQSLQYRIDKYDIE
jgi:arginine utilization regulatory protein